MNMRKLVVGAIAIAFCSMPAFSLAATGFIDAPMWIYPEAPTQNQSVTLYALFRNDENTTVSGTVLFYDKDTIVGKKNVTVAPGGVGTANTTFRISAGSHTFSASMGSLTKIAPNGTSSALLIPMQSTQMPTIVVSANSASASAVSSTANSSVSDPTSKAVLGQVDSFENTALSVVPPSFQDKVTAAAKSVDTWRAVKASTFTVSREKASSATIPPATKYVDGPLKYVKIAFFSLLAFVFSFPVIFYIAGIVVFYIVVRFIVRKISNGIRNRRYHSSSGSYSSRG